MSALVSALDSFTPTRLGENGHVELGWSNDVQEKICQFDFQCVRTDSAGVQNLATILDDLLSRLSVKKSTEEDERSRLSYLVTLYKIIGKTRDINGGKGEYSLSYMMILTWYKHFPVMAKYALQLFVLAPHGSDDEPYGSWKDVKYFCQFIRGEGAAEGHELIVYCIDMMNTQLRKDMLLYESAGEDDKKTLSLVAKWVARESSDKFGWLYESLATNYFPEYIRSAKTVTSKMKAVKKCKAQYRILCSLLNRHLDTVQIKQTSKNWAAIEHAKTTSITMAKQRKAFLNQKSKGEARSDDPDRIQCAENLRAYMDSLKKEGKEIKGKNVGLEMFAAQALGLLGYSYREIRNQEEADILNSQWRDNCNKKNANGLGPMVAVVDTSGSMSGDPLHAALSLGCRVAEKSLLGKRVLTFSAEPAWINLDGCDTFTDMVGAIMKKSNTAGLNTNFYKALDMILSVIEEKRIPAADVENMILAVFSDMQIDDNLHIMTTPGAQSYPNESQKVNARGKWAIMQQQIKQKYAEVGMRMYGEPLNPPHILFWNLKKTNGFPTLSTEAGCSMMSGFDPTILNMFCELGMEALKDMTPYKTLLKLLDNPRYTPLEVFFRENM
jgi:hypothetical protein